MNSLPCRIWPVKMFHLLVFCIPVLFFGCGTDRLPVEKFQDTLKAAPSYSVILNDMKEEGNFFREYFHQYRIVQEDSAWTSRWYEVPEEYYRRNEPFLGMVIAGRKGTEPVTTPMPPGYMYVGDNRYGRWRTGSAGNDFWEFNRGGNALFRELELDLHLPVSRSSYSSFIQSKSKKIPFFGEKKEYGTSGVLTQKTRPNFFQRRMAVEAAKKASFSQKVSERVGRTRTNVRGRSGSGGK